MFVPYIEQNFVRGIKSLLTQVKVLYQYSHGLQPKNFMFLTGFLANNPWPQMRCQSPLANDKCDNEVNQRFAQIFWHLCYD